MYTHEDIITTIVMFSKVLIPEAIEFWFKLGFNPYYYRPLSNEQLVIIGKKNNVVTTFYYKVSYWFLFSQI